jgi:hypothetical protein
MEPKRKILTVEIATVARIELSPGTMKDRISRVGILISLGFMCPRSCWSFKRSRYIQLYIKTPEMLAATYPYARKTTVAFRHIRRTTMPSLSPGPSTYLRKKIARVLAKLAKSPSNIASAASTGTRKIKMGRSRRASRS